MQTSKLSTWLEVATGIAVLVGLLLVVQELRQNNQYAKAESTRDLFQMWSDVYEFAAENKIDQLRRKASDSPAELSDDDLIALDTFYWKMMNAEWAQGALAAEGLLLHEGQEEFEKLIAESYFLDKFGRAWFAVNEEECRLHEPRICQTISEAINSSPVQPAYDYLSKLRSLL